MSLSVNGNSLVFTGTVTLSNAFDPTTGVATLTLTPSGGVGTLPALVNGQPGQPPIFDSTSVTTLAAGAPATASITQVSPGGAGISSHYTVAFGVPQGVTGAAGTNATIHAASDLSGTAVTGNILTVASTGPTAFQYSAFPWAFALNPASVATVSLPGNATGTICTVSVAAQPFSWYPLCFATATVNGASTTVVSLQALLTAGSRTGDIVGSSGSASGVAANVSLLPGFGALIGSGAYGKVVAGATATITFTAVGAIGTSGNWIVNTGTQNFTVLGVPVSL
jgi:hypothetical protein